MGKKKNKSKKSSGGAAPPKKTSDVNDADSAVKESSETLKEALKQTTKETLKQTPKKTSKETTKETSDACNVSPIADVSKDHRAFLQKAESASAEERAKPPPVRVRTEVVEKVVEKVVSDPSQAKQVDELKKENEELHRKLAQAKKENSALETTLKATQEEVKASSQKAEVATSPAPEVAELEAKNKDLANQVANYQEILANTESLLKNLENSVNSEESTWHLRLSQKEEVIRQLLVDKETLTRQVADLEKSLDVVKQAEEAAANLCDLQFAYNCMEKSLPSILSQMESQLKTLKEQLTKEEEAKKKMQEELILAQEQLKTASAIQISTNGPANGIECHEDALSHGDSASVVSSEGQDSANAQARDESVKKPKKKKSLFSKLIRKSTGSEVSSSTVKEDISFK